MTPFTGLVTETNQTLLGQNPGWENYPACWLFTIKFMDKERIKREYQQRHGYRNYEAMVKHCNDQLLDKKNSSTYLL